MGARSAAYATEDIDIARNEALAFGGQPLEGFLAMLKRFAIHKLLVSRLRAGRDAKAQKDVFQASVLAAVLGDQQPGALEAARKAAPKKAGRLLRQGIAAAEKHLKEAYPSSWEEMAG